MRMKFMRILPETRARTRCPLLSSTRKKALGSGSTTVPSTSIASSLVDPIVSARSAFFFFLSERLNPPGRLCGAKLLSLYMLSKAGKRLVQRLLFAQCENLVAIVRDGHGVLEVRRQAAIRGHDGPLISLRAYLPGAGVDHRLDRHDHARLEHRTRPRAAVVWHRRILMQARADTVAHESAHDCIPLALDVGLHGMADVRDVCPRVHGLNAPHQRLSRDIDKPLCFG